MINNVTLIGNLTRDPDLMRTSGNKYVCKFTIAINRAFKNANGEREVDFIPCVVWGSQAENLAKYCTKGDTVGVTGSIKIRNYTDKNGDNRTATEIDCQSISFIKTSKDKQQNQYSNVMEQLNPNTTNFNNNSFSENFNFDDGDLPF